MGFSGHISLRIDEHLLLVRCRGPRERGLGYTTGEDIRLVDLDGQAGASGDSTTVTASPTNCPCTPRCCAFAADINVVVHAHPPDVVAADLAGIAIRPIVGAFDIPGTRLAAAGVPSIRAVFWSAPGRWPPKWSPR